MKPNSLSVLPVFVVVLVFLPLTGTTWAEETTKTFPSYQCSYTLPGKDWSWDDPAAVPNAICVARSTDGLIFMLTVVPIPQNIRSAQRIDDRFAANFEQGLYATTGLKKRSARFTTFKGLSCYESLALVNGELTAVMRVVVANDFTYQLQLLGGAEPVELRSDFETIMN